MKRILALFIIIGFVLASCADSKTFTTQDGKQFIAEPYGWANSRSKKNPNVRYEVSIGNIAWSLILSETGIVPIALTGWYLFEPVEYVENNEKAD